MLPQTASLPAPDDAAPDDAARRGRFIAVLVVAAVVLVAALAVDAVRPPGPADPPPGRWTLIPHRGLGAWVDAYDWTVELGGPEPSVGLEDVDAMAAAGVQTLYLQTSHRRSAEDVMERERLEGLIERAHERHLHVVAWYLPTFVDVDEDLARLVAAAELPVDGLGVDIEATDVVDPVERTRRVLDLSTRLRAAVGPDRALAAITLSSVHLQVVNPGFWPGFPWAELGATYDVLLPMAYWTLRVGDLRDGGRYVGDGIDRIRAAAGPDVPIHVIGGVADAASAPDLQAMVRAIRDRGAIGGSLYDWNTSTPGQWAALAPLRALRTTAPSAPR